jgi:hypothetical protein
MLTEWIDAVRGDAQAELGRIAAGAKTPTRGSQVSLWAREEALRASAALRIGTWE